MSIVEIHERTQIIAVLSSLPPWQTMSQQERDTWVDTTYAIKSGRA